MAIYGPEGVRFYTRIKTITSRWPTGIPHRRGYQHANAGLNHISPNNEGGPHSDPFGASAVPFAVVRV